MERCPYINDGCPNLRRLNSEAEKLDKMDKFKLSCWGIHKVNGQYIHNECLNTVYISCKECIERTEREKAAKEKVGKNTEAF